VRLVDHEGDPPGRLRGRGIAQPGRDLAHDPEQLERVDRAHDQVVVGVLAVVEVEAAEQALREQQRDDLLDVRPLRVVARVDEHLRARAECAAHERGRAPVGQVGRVEGRLEELVLDEQPHVVRHRRIELLEPHDEPAEAPAQVVLARVVRAVGEPEADVGRADRRRDLDALEAVLERLPPDARVGVAEAAEPVLVVLEQVRVDGAEADALLLGEAADVGPVVGAVPRDVDRDARTGARQPVDERRVGHLLVHRAGGSWPREDPEARARVGVAPGRRLDLERPEPGEDSVGVHRRSVWTKRARNARLASPELSFETH
jgi:hypothetical protein